jgi:hypothetical protein
MVWVNGSAWMRSPSAVEELLAWLRGSDRPGLANRLPGRGPEQQWLEW